MKKVIVGFIIAISILGAGMAMYYSRQPMEEVDTLSHDDFVYAITDRFPSLVRDGKPVIEVVDAQRIENTWYIITIKSIHEEKMSVPVKVILLDNGQSSPDLRAIAGPDIRFTETEMLRYNLPDSVILELQES